MESYDLFHECGFALIRAAVRARHMHSGFLQGPEVVAQFAAEFLGQNVEDLKYVLQRIETECPSVFDMWSKEEKDPTILLPPVSHCLLGCTYRKKQGENLKGDPQVLQIRMERPVECKVCDLNGKVTRAIRFNARCRMCSSDYQYETFRSKHKLSYLYSEKRPLVQVSGVVYWKRQLCEELTKQIVINQTTFQGFSELLSGVSRQLTDGGGFSRQLVSDAFFRYHMENEIRKKGWQFYGFQRKTDWITELRAVNSYNAVMLYPHMHNTMCGERGCQNLYCLDGIWKITHKICSFKTAKSDTNFPYLNLPDDCPNEPDGIGKYCLLHKGLAPQYIMKPGISPKKGRASKSQRVKRLQVSPKACKKSLGERKYETSRSRGYLCIVSAGGFIRSFCPLYGSESASQVFYNTILWLHREFQDSSTWPPEKWSHFFLAYDNMCNLDNIRQARADLHYPEPFNEMWKRISKIIDRFHLDNHVRPQCKEIYNPEKLLQSFPNVKSNTQAAEQMFSYLGKFKNQLFNMSKDHQLFFLHVIILAINAKHQRILEAGQFPIHINGRRRVRREN